MKLVASLIVRNEVTRYLPANIAALREYADEIVVLDDASDDGTSEWLIDQADQQLRVWRNGEPGFFVHEGRERQRLLDATLARDPSHVLAIDADEFVTDGVAIRTLARSEPTMPAWSLLMEEVWYAFGDRLQVREDGGWKAHNVPILWTVPRGGPQLRIQNRALACGREPQTIRRFAQRARKTGESVLHFGWANPEERQKRYDRYAVADGGRFHRNEHLLSILWPDDKVILRDWEWPAGLRQRVRLGADAK